MGVLLTRLKVLVGHAAPPLCRELTARATRKRNKPPRLATENVARRHPPLRAVVACTGILRGSSADSQVNLRAAVFDHGASEDTETQRNAFDCFLAFSCPPEPSRASRDKMVPMRTTVARERRVLMSLRQARPRWGCSSSTRRRWCRRRCRRQDEPPPADRRRGRCRDGSDRAASAVGGTRRRVRFRNRRPTRWARLSVRVGPGRLACRSNSGESMERSGRWTRAR